MKFTQQAAEIMYAALIEIQKGEGRFSRDPLTHADNTIEDLTGLAAKALERVNEILENG